MAGGGMSESGGHRAARGLGGDTSPATGERYDMGHGPGPPAILWLLEAVADHGWLWSASWQWSGATECPPGGWHLPAQQPVGAGVSSGFSVILLLPA